MRELFRNIFTSFRKIINKSIEKPIVLGRWGIHTGVQQGIKIDMTNEDHCGVCDQMRNEFIDKNQKDIKTKR